MALGLIAVVDLCVSLTEVRAVMERLQQGQVHGRIVVEIHRADAA